MNIEYSAHIGLDWATKKHDICLKSATSEKLEYSVIEHSPEAIKAWALALGERFNYRPIAICLELKAGPIVYALMKYSFIHLYPISPKALARYREAFTQSGAKDDPSDARLQLDYLTKHGEALRVLKPDTQATRAIQQLTEDRRSLVEDKVRLSNRLAASLKNYFPQVLDWFDEIDTHLFCQFIQRWPTLEELRRVRRATLVRFFKSHRCVRDEVIEQRLDNIKQASALTLDETVIDTNQKLVLVLTQQLDTLIEAIHAYDLDIARRFRAHQEYELFNSLPGAGPVMAPRLLAVFGTDRNRYADANEVARMSGIAPVLQRSGTKAWVHWRYSCPKFIRQTFVEWVRVSIRYSFWAREYYDKKRTEGKSHQATIRALAFKWIRILFRCWQDRKPYHEASYLFALQQRKAKKMA